MTKKSNKKKAKVATSEEPKREVVVVQCPTAFPISNSTTSKKRRLEPFKPVAAAKPQAPTIDLHQAAKDIRAYGAQAFEGKQKKKYRDEQYFLLTGRHKKQPKCPLPLVRALKKAAAKREAKQVQEARDAGIVLPTKAKQQKMNASTVKQYGPAPNIGFMKSGIYRVPKGTK